MSNTDARSMASETQEQLRKQAIRLWRKGKKYREIADIVGVHAKTIGQWVRKYKKYGAGSLKSQKRGRRMGEDRLLSLDQEIAIQKEICDKSPDQLKLAFALWTRPAVQQLIRQMFDIKIAIRSVGTYLNRWGFTPQKPLRVAYEQCPEKVKVWLHDTYPAIKHKCRLENGEIHWGDETGVRSDCQHGRSYAPRGKTPTIRISARRCSLNMISTVTNQGKVRFMIYTTKMTAQVLIKFMKKLIKGASQKIFLILDNLRVHHANLVREWLERKEIKSKIEVFFLPAYSPELNPDEYLNCDLKCGVHSGPPARNLKGLKRKVDGHMRKLQKLPKRVASYFDHTKIRYAG